MKIDKNLIKELSEYLNEFNLTEIEFTEKDTKIKVSKNNISINNQTIPVTQKPSNITDTCS
jgi:acetyl-CoA carboxylase biotin carboxyl carrier protein